MLRKDLILVILVIMVLFMGSVVFVSCKKNKNDEPGPNRCGTTGATNDPADTLPVFKCTIGESLFTADTTYYNNDLGFYTFTGQDSSNHKVKLNLSNLAPGTYPLDFDQTTMEYIVGNINYNGGNNPMGSIIITDTTSQRISGTFSASLTDMFVTGTDAEITLGEFKNLRHD
jgi:hypothetical protein